MKNQTINIATEIPESESMFIACPCLEPATALPASNHLKPSDFLHPACRKIFQSAKALQRRGAIIDPVTLREHAGGDETLRLAIGQATEVHFVTKNARACANVVRDRSRARQAIDLFRQATKSVGENPTDLNDVLRATAQGLLALDTQSTDTEIELGDALKSAIHQLEERSRAKGLPGVPTGIRELDLILGGLQASDLIVIGARPAMGKTALLLTLAEAARVPLGIISA